MKLEIEAILKRYYEGETTIEEEKMLREFFQNQEIPADLESHAAQFRILHRSKNNFRPRIYLKMSLPILMISKMAKC